MKPSELRIGNYIDLDTPISDTLVRVSPYHISCIHTSEKINKNHIYKPIPLTEEWLLKFHPNAMDLSNQIFRIGRFKLIWKFSYEYWYVVDDMTGAYMTKIEFVHEWKNFWFIMNSEELTLNK